MSNRLLIKAIVKNDIDKVKELAKERLDTKDECPRTPQDPLLPLRDEEMDPLHLACMKGRNEIVAILVQTGYSDVNSVAAAEGVNQYYMTPLHRAVLHEQIHTVKVLLKLGNYYTSLQLFFVTIY